MSSIIVILPAAGYGTRMLPASKSIPKELLPIINKPVLQYIYDEISTTKLNDIILVIGRNKEAIPNYLDRHTELENKLIKKKKIMLLDSIRPKKYNNIFVRQINPLGTGHVIKVCKPIINNKSICVMMPDMIVDQPNYLNHMIDIHIKTGKGVVALMEVPKEDVSKYD
jgi:UTP--glucose-1-phosphate uridylyltransferase